MNTVTFWITVYTRTVSPSVHPRPASGGATDFFLASALLSREALRTSRAKRRAMRPTDVCHPNDLRAPAPRVFPVRDHHFRGVDTPRSLRLRTVVPGDRTFHDVRDRFGGSSRNTSDEPIPLVSRRSWSTSVGVFFPRRWCDRASDTPVVTFSSILTPHLPSPVLQPGRASSWGGFAWVGG